MFFVSLLLLIIVFDVSIFLFSSLIGNFSFSSSSGYFGEYKDFSFSAIPSNSLFSINFSIT